MIRVLRVAAAGAWPAAEAIDSVTLDFDARYRRRIRLSTDGGRDVLLDLDHATVLNDGDGLALEDGGWIAVKAAAEDVLEITAATPHDLLRLAWHLGNRHTPAQIEPGRLLIRPDHVLADMLTGLGGTVRPLRAPFTPEAGAYHRHADGTGHSHD